MTTDTPRTDAQPSTQSMLRAQSDPVKLYQQLCKVTVDFGKALDACVIYQNQLSASRAEVARLREELDATCNAEELRQERETRKRAEAEVERLKANLRRAIEIVWGVLDDTPSVEGLFRTEEIEELNQIKDTLNPTDT
jgi:hypothetical protein